MVGPRRRDWAVVLMTIMRLEDQRDPPVKAVVYGHLERGVVYAGVKDNEVYLCVFLDGMRHLVQLSQRTGYSMLADHDTLFIPLKSKLVIEHE